jgi:hypothetical protein
MFQAEKASLHPGRACNLVLNISIGLMTVALIVRARAPATRGAGVKDAVTPGVRERDNEDVLAAGSVDPVKVGDIRARRYSYPSI